MVWWFQLSFCENFKVPFYIGEYTVDEGKYEKIPVSSVVDPDTDPH